MTPDLRLDGLAVRLGERRFLYEAELAGPGIVAVTGPSGSGKSTLFHLIAGFAEPAAGRVLINGADMAGIDPGRRPLTYIFQDTNLFTHLDVRTNVGLGLSPSLTLDRDGEKIVERALERVGLAGFGARRPAALSGGERQRVAFARALVRRRPLLLLDEAFASLDAASRREMGVLLRALQQEHAMLVLMITHDMAEVAALADRVMEIEDGRIIRLETAGSRAIPSMTPG